MKKQLEPRGYAILFNLPSITFDYISNKMYLILYLILLLGLSICPAISEPSDQSISIEQKWVLSADQRDQTINAIEWSKSRKELYVLAKTGKPTGEERLVNTLYRISPNKDKKKKVVLNEWPKEKRPSTSGPSTTDLVLLENGDFVVGGDILGEDKKYITRWSMDGELLWKKKETSPLDGLEVKISDFLRYENSIFYTMLSAGRLFVVRRSVKDGSEKWRKQIDIGANPLAFDISPTSKNEFFGAVQVGKTSKFGTGDTEVIVFRGNKEGTNQILKRFSGRLPRLKQLSEELVVLYDSSTSMRSINHTLLQLSKSGDKHWEDQLKMAGYLITSQPLLKIVENEPRIVIVGTAGKSFTLYKYGSSGKKESLSHFETDNNLLHPDIGFSKERLFISATSQSEKKIGIVISIKK